MVLRGNIATVVAGFLCALAWCVLGVPQTAHADYVNPSATTVAQVRTDGSLHVAEQRTYDFEDEYSILEWKVTGWNGAQKVDVGAVRLMQADGEGNIVRDWTALPQVAFQSTWRDFVEETEGLTQRVNAAIERAEAAESTADNVALPKEDAWAFDSRRNVIYVFLRPTDAVTAIECDYLVDNAALVWDDVGELYWDYVAVNEDAIVRNVSVQVQLPVPEGATVVPGDNLVSWGHGPQGSVSTNEDGTVDYEVSEVAPGQYAQAHIVFPRSWLTNLTIQAKLAKSGVHYDDALADEDAWVDTYSTWRINTLVVDIVLLVICVLSLVGSLVVYAVLGRERRPRADACGECDAAGEDGECSATGESDAADVSAAGVADDAADDAADRGGATAAGGAGCVGVPADASCGEAAVRGRLMRWNQESADDFPATLAQLACKGVVRIDAERVVATEPLALSDSADSADLPNASDRAPLVEECNVRFRVTPTAKLAPLSPLERDAMSFVFDAVGDGYQSVSLREVRDYCARCPREVKAAMAAWQSLLTKEVGRAGLFDERSHRAGMWMLLGAVLLGAVALYRLLVMHSLLEAVALFATAAAVSVIAHFVPRRTQRGADLAECMRVRGVQDADAVAADGCGGDAAWMAQLSAMLAMATGKA